MKKQYISNPHKQAIGIWNMQFYYFNLYFAVSIPFYQPSYSHHQLVFCNESHGSSITVNIFTLF